MRAQLKKLYHRKSLVLTARRLIVAELFRADHQWLIYKYMHAYIRCLSQSTPKTPTHFARKMNNVAYLVFQIGRAKAGFMFKGSSEG